ncbi:MAG: nitrous oxide reductase accessory protein NosL [Chlamydiae bacterium]|nr:nitrous oxide reductase accessory protein NosL [Chlamydiota bacterium]
MHIEEGEILKFDDIGCMALFEKKNQPKIEEAWVHEGLRRGWIERSKAYYVFDPALTTPMGSQLIALGSKESLQEYLKKNDTSQIGFGEIDEFLKKK